MQTQRNHKQSQQLMNKDVYSVQIRAFCIKINAPCYNLRKTMWQAEWCIIVCVVTV